MKGSLFRHFQFSLVVTLIFIIVTIGVSYAFLAHNIRNQSENAIHNTLTETILRAEKLFTSQRSMSEMVANDTNVAEFLMAEPLERLRLRDSVRSLLMHYASFSDNGLAAYLYSAEDSRISANIDSRDGEINTFAISIRLFQDCQLDQPFRNTLFVDCSGYDKGDCYAVISPVFCPGAAPQMSDYNGALILFLRIESLRSVLPAVGGNITSFIRMGNRFCVGDRNAYGSWIQNAQKSAGSAISHTDWSVELLVDTGQEESVLLRFRIWAVAMIGVSVVAITLLMSVQYRHIVHPIIDIACQASLIRSYGELLVNRQPHVNEFCQLVYSLNDMLTRINQLNKEIAEARLKVYEEQIAFLQAQINPHFLYNTFECIRGMVSEGKMEEVRSTASCMADIYRYCAVKTPLVPLKMEYDCLRNYMKVMKLRYGSVYSLELIGDERALEAYVPRMCLQPLVENAIIHGFALRSPKSGNIFIYSEIISERWLSIVVEDDGYGMSKEEIRTYNEEQEALIQRQRSNIGISNVMCRLRLLFPECTIHFSESPKGGLKIQMQLLLKNTSEETTYQADVMN